MTLYIAGQDIPAGFTVVAASGSEKAFIQGNAIGIVIGVAMENLREGFRICARDQEVREDDA